MILLIASVNIFIKNLIISLFKIIITFICFQFLGSTAENYLTPAVQKLAEALKFTESLAAVTLLALGNGAPDVIAAVVAGGEEGGLSLIIGSFFGAGLFVTLLTLS